ncbi:MAG: acyl-CoA dehydrogenase family protein [Pseudomonadota bacterium]
MSDDMNISDMLADQLERLFAREVTSTLLAKSEQGCFPAALWQQVSEMGVVEALASDANGGSGLGWADIEAVVRTCGRHAAPIPLAETMLAAWALSQAGLDRPEGAVAVSGAVWTIDAAGAVSGADSLIAWLPDCDHLLLVARGADGDHVCLFERAALPLQAAQTIERTPAASLVLAAQTPVRAARAAGIGALGLLPHLAALRCVQMAGLLDRMLALCVDYGNTRVQFGKPIGKFQAIQHMIAELAGHAAAAQVAGLYACRQIDSGQPARAEFGAAVAKTRLGGAATRSSAIAHQVFGAIGVTDEHQLHYFTRRLWQWRAEAGSEHEWSAWLGRQAIDAGGAALWPALAVHAA